MTQVDFHVLPHDDPMQRLHYGCRLMQKALQQGNSILVHCRDAEELATLDRLLWDFRPESYLPHGLADGDNEDLPILLGTNANIAGQRDVLLNLSGRMPEGVERFKRYVEIVIQSNNALESSRNNHQHFKNLGYPINVHKR